jgi:hypothetical protein
MLKGGGMQLLVYAYLDIAIGLTDFQIALM